MEKNQKCATEQERFKARSGHGDGQRAEPRKTQTTTESDKDSGYSDVASECLSSVEQTDTEEGPTTSRWNVALKPSGKTPSQPQSLVVLKNLLVDQGSGPEPNASSWAVHPSIQLLQTSPQIVFFPPTVSSSKPSTCRKDTKYLPILKSYTKIAPHPSHRVSNISLPCARKRGPDERPHNQTKRQCSKGHSGSRKGMDAATLLDTGVQQGPVDQNVKESSVSAKNKELDMQLTTQNINSNEKGSRVASLDTQQNLLSAGQQNKSQRFQNTLDILHRSGLLSIAMKTKELARHNQATQSQLEKLQEQVQLYATAMSSNNPHDWQRLQDSLAEVVKGDTEDLSVREMDL
ncbi:CLOCK-interacting pacemaker [Xenopus laevis]|uniref:CLOCK-interacting pacemaker n=1 Tax=Xenopus laevis TaxID=8355 RepID=CIPC_XENLA|nr:CLOCK-interacting pacemaker [Xenopus laevis]Q6NRH7.1 RecName: Full=CLOCK-interacting pacemaker; AltName: Full=CLOCK-interacting circadian protein [Xenopus laevis]AAH70773.1 MGC83807 protein [Xenopus laevis]